MNKKRWVYIIMMTFLILWPTISQARLNWDQYLDVAYKVTWWEDKEIAQWVTQTEKQLGQDLKSYVSRWQNNIKGTAENAKTVRTDNESQSSYPFQAYRRLATAELLLYLRSHEKNHLNEAVRIINRIGEDHQKTDVAFWQHYIHAHEAISADNHKGKNVKFINATYKLWTDVILKLEKAQIQSSIPEVQTAGGNLYNDLPYLYENIVNLIIDRAIVKNHMNDLEALGSIIWAVEPRLTLKDGYAEQVKLINKRVHGPKSDVFRLTFTVMYLEAEKYRFKAQNLLDKQGPTDEAEDTFMQALKYYELAYKYARTRQGQISAVSDHLDLVSFALARIPSRKSLSKDQRFLSIVGHEGANMGTLAVGLFNGLAKYEKEEIAQDTDSNEQKSSSEKGMIHGYWEKHGFSDRQTYVYAMHALWRSISELHLWTANYYLKEIKSANIKDFYNEAPPAQAALVQYLEFFDKNAGDRYLEIVPDNAYFSAAEAASTLFDVYYHLAPYSSNLKMYDLAFGRLLQSVEIFPFNLKNFEKLAQFLSDEGMLDLYGKVQPLSRYIRSSIVLQTGINESKNGNIKTLIKVTPKIIISAATIHFLQKAGDSKIRENIRYEIKEINNEIEGYALGNRIRVQFQNNLDSLNAQLGKVSNTLDSKEVIEEHPEALGLISRIKKVQLKIQTFQSASTLLASYPSYNKMSLMLKDTLLRNIEHPAHMLLRKFYHERNPERLNYINFIGGRITKQTDKVNGAKKQVSKQADRIDRKDKSEASSSEDNAYEKMHENAHLVGP